jgi:hypothetical protein
MVKLCKLYKLIYKIIKFIKSNFLKLITRRRKKNNLNINKKIINKFHIIDSYKKEYTTHTPFSNCLNYKDNFLNILDIGCFGEEVPEQYTSQKNIKFYGVDIDAKNINYLKKKNYNNTNYFFYNNQIVAPKNLDIFHEAYKHNFKNKYKNIAFESATYQKYSLIKPNINQINQKVTDASSKPTKSTIDEIILKNNIDNINFLKIDIDSNDTDVLYGSENLLKNDNLFGVKIEVNFTDPVSSKNIYEPYLYLSDHNFVLHKIITNSYASDKIPEKFFYNFSAQNFNGTNWCGDLIFFKTLDNNFIKTLDKNKLLNFCRILEIHKLNGIAAEILLKNKNKFNSKELENYLNKLCEKSSLEVFGKILDYENFIYTINKNPNTLLNNIW